MNNNEDDATMVDVLSMTDEEIYDFINDTDLSYHGNEDQQRRLYMADLAVVLNTPQGLRVVRWFVDAAGDRQKVFASNSSVYRNAAMADYAKDRLAECCAADPKAFIKLLLEGAKPQGE